MSLGTCVRCGVFLEALTDVTYSDSGDPMCVKCRDGLDLAQKERREARTLLALSLSALAGGVIGLPATALFVMGGIPFSLPALGSGLVCLRGLRAAPPGVLAALGTRKPLVRAAGGVGVVSGGLGVGVMVLQVLLVIFRLAGSH